MNVLVLLLFTMVVVVAVVLALTMHRLIAFRSPTASLQRLFGGHRPHGIEVATLELQLALSQGAPRSPSLLSLLELRP